MENQSLVRYDDAIDRWRRSSLRASEFPVEHYSSILVPTRRLGFPAYATFAAPARRQPGQAAAIGQPDRWVAISAFDGRPALYARTSAVPFGAVDRIGELSAVEGSVREALDRIQFLQQALAEVSPEFFETGSLSDPEPLRDAFLAATSPETLPAYRALAPDFAQALGL